MAAIKYPLEQVVWVKENRVKEQEKVVATKRQALQKEQEKLKLAEEARDKVMQHYRDKLAQMRAAMDSETNTNEIQQMKFYLKAVQEKLVVEEKKVKDQQVQVQQAEKNLQAALDLLKVKRQEVDKFLEHKKGWLKAARKEQEFEEAKEQEEVGSTIFVARHFKRRH